MSVVRVQPRKLRLTEANVSRLAKAKGLSVVRVQPRKLRLTEANVFRLAKANGVRLAKANELSGRQRPTVSRACSGLRLTSKGHE